MSLDSSRFGRGPSTSKEDTSMPLSIVQSAADASVGVGSGTWFRGWFFAGSVSDNSMKRAALPGKAQRGGMLEQRPAQEG